MNSKMRVDKKKSVNIRIHLDIKEFKSAQIQDKCYYLHKQE